MTTILVCEGSPLIREQLRRAVATVRGVDRVVTAASEDEAVRVASANSPSLILVDVGLPEQGGLHAVRRIRGVDGSARIVMLTLAEQDRAVVAAVAAGARGYIVKDASRAELRVAVAQMLTEQPAYAVARPSVPAPRRDEPALTERELEVLAGMCEGRSNIEIGRALFLSEDTVKTHARRLYRKLGAADRAHAVAIAMRRGLVR